MYIVAETMCIQENSGMSEEKKYKDRYAIFHSFENALRHYYACIGNNAYTVSLSPILISTEPHHMDFGFFQRFSIALKLLLNFGHYK